MSAPNTQAARQILDNLLKSKKELKSLRSEIRVANSELSSLMSMASQLARGDVTGVVTYLASLGPYGVATAVALGTAAVAYGIYQQVTAERPTEMYYWRYPK